MWNGVVGELKHFRFLPTPLNTRHSKLDCAFIAQWIEQTSPKGKIGVRFPVRASSKAKTSAVFAFCFMKRDDRRWMREALLEARKCLRGDDGARDDVPVGAVVVVDNQVVGRGHNRVVQQNDATLHAEVVAIRQAVARLGTSRLESATLYVSLEPCPMCAGALWLARFERLVFGAFDAKAGACGSVFDIARDVRLNHHLQVRGGVLEEECAAMLREFFTGKRHPKMT